MKRPSIFKRRFVDGEIVTGLHGTWREEGVGGKIALVFSGKLLWKTGSEMIRLCERTDFPYDKYYTCLATIDGMSCDPESLMLGVIEPHKFMRIWKDTTNDRIR